MILNSYVNFNCKKTTTTKNPKKREETNISVDVNMRTSIVMDKCQCKKGIKCDVLVCLGC